MKLEKNAACLSAILRLTVVISAIVGISQCAFDDTAFMGGRSVWLYFTIQSNIWVALCLLIGLIFQLMHRKPGRWYDVLQLVTTISILLTGVVFCFVLAPTIEHLNWSLSNVLTHIVVPVASVVDYLLVARTFRLRYSDVPYVLLPPFYYVIFAAIGFVCNWPFSPGCNYPYFFLNWGSPAGAFGFCDVMPWMGVVYYILILLVALSIVGTGLVAYSRLISNNHSSDPA